MHENLEILGRLSGRRVVVAGDIMLDIFVYGDVNRISPESPVPVLAVDREERMLGGAGNVVMNLSALGVTPVVFGIVGEDDFGAQVLEQARARGAQVDGILSDPTRPTTIKTRYLARHQQLLRSDIEKTHPLAADLEEKLSQKAARAIDGAGAVVISDYGKGVVTPAFAAALIGAATARGVPVLVDPKGRDYNMYRGASVVTPNRKELSEASGMPGLKTDSAITSAARTVMTKAGIGAVVATRSEDGLSVIDASGELHVPTVAREVFDVSGAGDTVIATLAACLCAGAGLREAAVIANIAAGIAVSKVGTTPVRIDELKTVMQEGLETNPVHAVPGATSLETAREHVRKWKAQGLTVGFTNGCFDILHKGHVGYLAAAKHRCDRLVVGLNSDASVRLLKGKERPVNDEGARATVLSALSSVDLVVLFGAEQAGEDNTPSGAIAALRPDIFFKGGDYTADQLPEAKIVHSYGGEVSIMPMYDGYSTTAIIAKSRKSS